MLFVDESNKFDHIISKMLNLDSDQGDLNPELC